MTNYQHKPTLVDARQFTGRDEDFMSWAGGSVQHVRSRTIHSDDSETIDDYLVLRNAFKGSTIVRKGSWLIRSGDDFVVVSPEWFESHYEKV